MPKTKWRLYGEHFRGPGKCTISSDGQAVTIDVDGDGYFEIATDDAARVPIYAFAGLAGGKRAQSDAMFWRSVRTPVGRKPTIK